MPGLTASLDAGHGSAPIKPSLRHRQGTGTELIKITWRKLLEANEGLDFRSHSGLEGCEVRSAKFYYRYYKRFEAAMC